MWFSLTFPVSSKFPDFSLTGKYLPIFPGFPVRVGTLILWTTSSFACKPDGLRILSSSLFLPFIIFCGYTLHFVQDVCQLSIVKCVDYSRCTTTIFLRDRSASLTLKAPDTTIVVRFKILVNLNQESAYKVKPQRICKKCTRSAFKSLNWPQNSFFQNIAQWPST